MTLYRQLQRERHLPASCAFTLKELYLIFRSDLIRTPLLHDITKLGHIQVTLPNTM